MICLGTFERLNMLNCMLVELNRFHLNGHTLILVSNRNPKVKVVLSIILHNMAGTFNSVAFI